jgi:AraC-like DNA-binding protein
MLSLHPRTLNRRLEDCGTTLRHIIGEIRYEIAKQLLADSNMSVIAISTLLGYADASVFTRAFRRWSGMTPTAWRMQNRQ